MLKFAIGLERGGQMNCLNHYQEKLYASSHLTMQLYDLILMIIHFYMSTSQLYTIREHCQCKFSIDLTGSEISNYCCTKTNCSIKFEIHRAYLAGQ